MIYEAWAPLEGGSDFQVLADSSTPRTLAEQLDVQLARFGPLPLQRPALPPPMPSRCECHDCTQARREMYTTHPTPTWPTPQARREMYTRHPELIGSW